MGIRIGQQALEGCLGALGMETIVAVVAGGQGVVAGPGRIGYRGVIDVVDVRLAIRRRLDGEVVVHRVAVTVNVHVIGPGRQIFQSHCLDVLVADTAAEQASVGVGHLKIKPGQARLLGQYFDASRPDQLETIPIDVGGGA